MVNYLLPLVVLNGYLEEEVYLEQPLGYVEKCHEDKVLKLSNALYGFKTRSKSME